MRKRVLFIFGACFFAVALLTLRLFWLQVVDGQSLRTQAQNMRTRIVPVAARRGTIFDRAGRTLAVSVDAQSVYADPAEVKNPQRVAAQLAPLLHLPASELAGHLSERTLFTWLARKVDDSVANAVRRLNLPGVYLLPEPKRVYPAGGLAAQVLGFTGLDNQGLAGVELAYDKDLRGQPGEVVVEYDARNQQIPASTRRYIAPSNGLGLQLSIDETLQYVVERELDKAMAQTGSKAGRILMMDPRTGEILALASRPSFDPNNWGASPEADWVDPLVTDAFSPGSVFKPVTAAAALAEGVVSPNTPFDDNGLFRVPGAVIHNWNNQGLGNTTFRIGFEQSANTVFARVGTMVGMQRFYKYLNLFGIHARTGVDLPGEGLGELPPEGQARLVDLAVMAFGQTLTVTPVEMLDALSAIANGGELMWPHVARAWVDDQGNVVRRVQPRVVRRVIPEQTAATLRKLMEQVVDEGTGQAARIPGYDIAGKTGTTQKVVGGKVSTDTFIASFAGFAPAEDPRVALYVMLDQPVGAHYGGTIAAPVFEAVMREALHYLGVPPQYPGEDGAAPPTLGSGGVLVPQLIGLSTGAAQAALRGAQLQMLPEGQGPAVASQVPPAGARVPQGTAILVYTTPAAAPQNAQAAAAAGGQVAVPNVVGKSMRDAAAALGVAGLGIDAQGSGVARREDPSPGVLVPGGTTVRIVFAPTGG